MSKDAKMCEIDKNFAYFEKILPTLRESTHGRHALLRHEEIIAFYDTARDAQMTGETFYEDDMFSVQEVRTQPVDLGAFSHAMHLGQAQ